MKMKVMMTMQWQLSAAVDVLVAEEVVVMVSI
jgi:hypothetical protein